MAVWIQYPNKTQSYYHVIDTFGFSTQKEQKVAQTAYQPLQQAPQVDEKIIMLEPTFERPRPQPYHYFAGSPDDLPQITSIQPQQLQDVSTLTTMKELEKEESKHPVYELYKKVQAIDTIQREVLEIEGVVRNVSDEQKIIAQYATALLDAKDNYSSIGQVDMADEEEQLQITAAEAFDLKTLQQRKDLEALAQYDKYRISLKNLQQTLLIFQQMPAPGPKDKPTDFSPFQLKISLYQPRNIGKTEKKMHRDPMGVFWEVKPQLQIPALWIADNDSLELDVALQRAQTYTLVIEGFWSQTRVFKTMFQFSQPLEEKQAVPITAQYLRYKKDFQVVLNIQYSPSSTQAQVVSWDQSGYLQFSVPLFSFLQQLRTPQDKILPLPDGALEIFVVDAQGKPKYLQKFPAQVWKPQEKLVYQLRSCDSVSIRNGNLDSCLLRETVKWAALPGDSLLFVFRASPAAIAPLSTGVREAECPNFRRFQCATSQALKAVILDEPYAAKTAEDVPYMYAVLSLYDSSGAMRSERLYDCRVLGGPARFQGQGKFIIADFPDNPDTEGYPACLRADGFNVTYNPTDAGYSKENATLLPFCLPIQLISNGLGVGRRNSQREIQQLLTGRLNDTSELIQKMAELMKLHSHVFMGRKNALINSIIHQGGLISQDDVDAVAEILWQRDTLESLYYCAEQLQKKDATVGFMALICLQLKDYYKVPGAQELRSRLLSYQMTWRSGPEKQSHFYNATGLNENLIRLENAITACKQIRTRSAQITTDFTEQDKTRILIPMMEPLNKFCTQLGSLQKSPRGPRGLGYDLAGFCIGKKYEAIENLLCSVVNLLLATVQLIGTDIWEANPLIDVRAEPELGDSFGVIISLIIIKTKMFIQTMAGVCHLAQNPEEYEKYKVEHKDMHLGPIAFDPDLLALDVFKMTNYYLKVVEQTDIDGEQFAEPLMAAFQLKMPPGSEDFVTNCLLNITGVAQLGSDLAVKKVLVAAKALIRNDFQLLLNLSTIIINNQNFAFCKQWAGEVIDVFLEEALYRMTQNRLSPTQIHHVIVNLSCLRSVNLREVQVAPTTFMAVTYTILQLPLSYYEKHLNLILTVLLVKLAEDTPDRYTQQYNVLYIPLLHKCLQIIDNANKSPDIEKQLQGLQGLVVRLVGVNPSDMTLQFLLDQVLYNISNYEKYQTSFSILEHAVRTIRVFTQHTSKQIVFTLGKYLRFDQTNITRELLIVFSSSLRKRVGTPAALQIANLIERYSRLHFDVADFHQLTSELIKPLRSSMLYHLAEQSEEGANANLALEHPQIAWYALKQMEPALQRFTSLLEEFNDPRVHWCLDVLYVLYLCTDSPKTVQILQRKQGLIVNRCPDLFFILQTILQQRFSLLQSTQDRDYVPVSTPTEKQRYPNFSVRGGLKTIRDLVKEYAAEFRSNHYYLLEDFISLHDFYRHDFCFVESAYFQLDFQRRYVDVQAQFTGLLSHMQAFLDSVVLSVPLSLVHLRTGLQTACTKTQSSRQLISILSTTIPLQKALRCRNYGLNFRYFSTDHFFGGPSPGLQCEFELCVQRIQTAPFLAKQDMECRRDTFCGLHFLVLQQMQDALQNHRNATLIQEKVTEYIGDKDATALRLAMTPTLIPAVDLQEVVALKFGGGWIPEYFTGSFRRVYLCLNRQRKYVPHLLQVFDNSMTYQNIVKVYPGEALTFCQVVDNETLVGDFVAVISSNYEFLQSECTVNYVKVGSKTELAKRYYGRLNRQLEPFSQQITIDINADNAVIALRILLILEYFAWLQTTVISLNQLDQQFEQTHGFRITYLALHQDAPQEKHILPPKLHGAIVAKMEETKQNPEIKELMQSIASIIKQLQQCIGFLTHFPKFQERTGFVYQHILKLYGQKEIVSEQLDKFNTYSLAPPSDALSLQSMTTTAEPAPASQSEKPKINYPISKGRVNK